MDEQRDPSAPNGVGPGITGASGEFIENTGGESGIGGTGHDDEAEATGQHPDERSLPRQEDAMGGGPAGARASRRGGSSTGTIGGGGPMSVSTKDGEDPRKP